MISRSSLFNDVSSINQRADRTVLGKDTHRRLGLCDLIVDGYLLVFDGHGNENVKSRSLTALPVYQG